MAYPLGELFRGTAGSASFWVRGAAGTEEIDGQGWGIRCRDEFHGSKYLVGRPESGIGNQRRQSGEEKTVCRNVEA